MATQALTSAELMATLTAITNSLNTLINQVNCLTETRFSDNGKGSVQLPKDYDSRDMEAVRMFLSAFQIWSQSNPRRFAKINADGNLVKTEQGKTIANMDKVILSVLSFLKEGPAAEWAWSYLDRLPKRRKSFNSFTEFAKAFLERVALVDATMHAFTKLQQLKQGQHRFARHIAIFNDLARAAGLSDSDKLQRLYESLHKEYMTRILERSPSSYKQAKQYGLIVDSIFDNINAQDPRSGFRFAEAYGMVNGPTRTPAPSTSSGSSSSPFCDPNAMDIDANWLDLVLAPLATEEEKQNKW